MTRRTRTYLGIALTLLLGLLGREGLALCLSADHLTFEVQSLSQHERQAVRAAECSAVACEDLSLGGAALSEARQKPGGTQKASPASGGGILNVATAEIDALATAQNPPAPSPERAPRLREHRTVVLLN
ncbi:MAG: hypothetical protein ACM31D_15145 [Bacteroidota bacterium]